MNIDNMLTQLLKHEGGYVNDPNDRGGETNWGVTIAVARDNGYQGPMRDMTRDQALEIYRRQYFFKPGFDKVMPHSAAIAFELFDTGVNMGPSVPSRWLQRSLNALSRQGKDYATITVDGNIGPATIRALKAFLDKRGDTGEHRLLSLLNALQGARYMELAERNSSQSNFLFGWLERVSL
ncbi:zliS Lysozyme family protein [uncultured Caudovirales phage]|uniref:ZliS Lysozyme family protein n=1 Tax=uncultured Caudovirales phage TaxID=2100421 RepID=A0A6J5M4D5_9CAUD|nr:zliS Lysozyme family protein [uncultured Caudovirales phage]